MEKQEKVAQIMGIMR